MDHLRHDLREAPAFAVYCHRHGCGVPLGLSRIPDVASLARSVLAVELECYDGERLTVPAFDEGADGLVKRIAKPHQYFAVPKAVGSTVQAVESNGKAGLVWHTQGSGKSMEMELYANLVVRQPKLLNPTLVVITDRTELDGQLFETFNKSLLLADIPVQVSTRAQLRDELINRTTGGIYFTTLQKFSRSTEEKQAGAETISFEDRNTRAVFGDYIDIYDLTRAVEDGATVPVYFEPRLIKVSLAEGVTQEQLDSAADEPTEGLDDAERARIEQSVAVVNAVYGAPERLAALAQDLVAHWEQRSKQMRPFLDGPGKALIVGRTREICANLYAAITTLRPGWHSDDLTRGKIKVVYSGTPSDPSPVVEHVRRNSQNKVIKERLKT